MSIIADPCGHFGCDDECIDDYELEITIAPVDEYGVILEITSIEKGRPDIEVSEEGWEFLEDLYNNPPQAIIDEYRQIREDEKNGVKYFEVDEE